jgi:hypothetical protein
MYLLIRAARYLHVPPWELAQQPIFWRNFAIACLSAENEAEEWHMKRASNRPN